MKTFILGLSSLLSVAAMPHVMTDPEPPSLCDKYTVALLKDNTADNQKALLTLVVNTAVIGNYTSNPGSLIAVPGILAPGEGDFEGVNLLPYFSGGLASTNAGGFYGVSVNFLDGGGADPIKMGYPANDVNSAQYILLTHLYPYFAGLLGCSLFGATVEPYPGRTSMYEVHKFMALDEHEVGWFVTNVGKSAASFGVTDDDVATVGKALLDTFGMNCAAPVAIPATAEPALQAICIEPTCPLADPPSCELYPPFFFEPYPVGGGMK